MLIYEHGLDPLTARWWRGLSEDERRQAHAEAQSYKNLSAEQRDQIWSEGAESIELKAEGDEIDLDAV